MQQNPSIHPSSMSETLDEAPIDHTKTNNLQFSISLSLFFPSYHCVYLLFGPNVGKLFCGNSTYIGIVTFWKNCVNPQALQHQENNVKTILDREFIWPMLFQSCVVLWGGKGAADICESAALISDRWRISLTGLLGSRALQLFFCSHFFWTNFTSEFCVSDCLCFLASVHNVVRGKVKGKKARKLWNSEENKVEKVQEELPTALPLSYIRGKCPDWGQAWEK